jgi:DNA-binding MarR family transcriptional regulator
MPSSRANHSNHRPTGQVLVRLLHHFRTELFGHADAAGHGGLRFPHIHIFGNVGRKGIRLTDLAHRAQLSLAACSELVNDLERLGYLERCPDPSDGRAKLIVPTARGGDLLDRSANGVAAIEGEWAALLGVGEFETAMSTLDRLLATLDDRRRLERPARRPEANTIERSRHHTSSSPGPAVQPCPD